MKRGLADTDIVMMLRLQTERMAGSFVPSIREYYHFFGLDYAKLAVAKPDALIMHPGPMNRGVEIDSEVADDIDRSLIRQQVEMGGGRPHGLPGGPGGESDDPQRGCRGGRPMTRVALANARLFDPATGRDTPGGLLIVDGRIADLGPALFADGVPEGRKRSTAPGGCWCRA